MSWYALTLWRYGTREVELDDDLDNLIHMAISGEEWGSLSPEEFWRRVDDEWVRIDVEERKDELERALRAAEAEGWKERAQPQWRVAIEGPRGLWVEWDAHELYGDAHRQSHELAAAGLEVKVGYR